ncbi:hypothetical protein [Polaromonas sp. CG9_12]|nr:hypothetical protein [Polaromonas sp. CG9_12]
MAWGSAMPPWRGRTQKNNSQRELASPGMQQRQINGFSLSN